jgi:hypothetical protein
MYPWLFSQLRCQWYLSSMLWCRILYQNGLVLAMVTRVASVIDATISDYMALTSDIKTGIRIRDLIH